MGKAIYKKIFLLLLAGVLCLGSFLLSAVFYHRAVAEPESAVFSQSAADEVTLVGAEYQSEYPVGTMVDIQQGMLFYEGQTLIGEHEVRCPDGRSLRSGSVVLDAVGKYTVVYRADFGGRMLSASRSFTAVGEAYSIEGLGGTASYGSHPAAPDTEGIVVSLARGNVFRYNRAVDLSGGTAAINVFRMFVTPTVKGEADFLSFTVTFTDAYDPDNYITVRVNSVENDKLIYTAAAQSGEVLTGMNYNSNTLHRGDEYGYVSSMDFYGNPDRPVERDVFELSFDYAQKQLHGARYASNSTLICDFDDPDYFTDLWSGFTTGEVFISVSADSMQKDTANFVITNIGGHDLSETELYDESKPAIEVDFEGYSEDDLPQAYVGLTYKVFDAECYDAYRTDAQLFVRAFYDYDGDLRTQIEIENGRFATERAGEYTVEYRAEDGSGNVGIKTYTVECFDEENEPDVVISEDRITEAKVGEQVAVAEVYATGGSGNVVLESKVICVENDQEIQITDGKFQPLFTGEYRIVYTVTDFLLQTVTEEYVFEAAPSGVPVFLENPVMPEYLIAGMTYEFPLLSAEYYKGDGTIEEIVADIAVEDEEGIKEGAVYVPPQAMAGKTVKVVYTANGESGADTLEWEISIVSVLSGEGENIDLTKYFLYGEDVQLSSDSEKISAETQTDGAEISFIRLLAADGFSFSFNVDPAKNNFTEAVAVLEDALDPSVKTEISFTKKRSLLSGVSVNGREYGNIESDFFGSGMNFDFSYDASAMQFSAGNASFVFSPEDFAGFPSGWVKFSVRFEGVTGESSIFLKELCRQPLTSVSRDAIKPNIIVDEDAFGGERTIGSKAVIPAALAYDVLDTYVNFSLSVYAPDGSAVTADDGTLLEGVAADVEYVISLTSYGYYSLRYVAADSSNRRQTLNYAINVADDVAPQITIEGTVPSSAGLGQTITLPSATATDNMPAGCVLYVCYVTPGGAYFEAADYRMQCTQAGIYKVKYMAMDDYGNTTVLIYEIEVK